MFKPLRKTHQFLNPINYSIIDLPAPSNLSLMWNFGSMLGMCMTIQIITGLLLAMHFSPHTDIAFMSVAHITRDVPNGWLLRNLHANGASAFFMCLYLHMMRGMYYSSFKLMETWNLGVTILILSMATAFMGYLLPWGQMSFWGATVITNLFSALPYMGKTLVEWIWGGFGVSNATLTRFFALHFLLPFLIAMLATAHLIFLHNTGSSNPLGTQANPMKIPFHSYYTIKDVMGILALILFILYISLFNPNLLTDPENFIPANPLITPTHIKPEWYFLWAYAILRSIPNKLGGVILMFAALLIFYVLPFSQTMYKSASISPNRQRLMWTFATVTVILTWIGGSPVETPFDLIGLVSTIMYFTTIIFLINSC